MIEPERGKDAAQRRRWLPRPRRLVEFQYLVLGTQYSVLPAFLLWLLGTTALEAQTPLRWKLEPRQSFAVEMHQETQSQVAFSGKSAATKIDLDVRLKWTVTAADDRQITLKQSVQRIGVKLATPQGASVDYDSDVRTRPMGLARDLAASLQPLVGAELEIAMNPRGEILEAKPLNDAAKALLSGKEAGGEGIEASRTAVQELLREPLLVLPEKEVAADDTWTTTTDLTTAAGPLKHETTYRLAGTVGQGGQQLYKITWTSKLTPRAAAAPGGQPPGANISIKSHEQTGTSLFSSDEGRVAEAEQTQKLLTERSYRDTTIAVTLSSTQKTTVKPIQQP
jgi:Family of unknown function (DUF6263)